MKKFARNEDYRVYELNKTLPRNIRPLVGVYNWSAKNHVRRTPSFILLI